ncbi:hypothetical protein NXS19_008753 [Fusarium pseudograminearum]|nr:hypothetical protein NXS19_008753 [Fusarium pseudograminearum]
MTYESNASSTGSYQSQVASRWSSGSESRDTKPSNTMLSINFSTPLAGAARSERIKQMTNNHPAFEKSRQSQEILVKIQTSLRRMPGVSSKESNEIITQLQEVGQIVSTETSQLVDALMNLTLDQEDTDKAIARMSIEANLSKAEADDQAHTLSTLRADLANERSKRQEAEAEVAKVMEELQKLSGEIKSLKGKSSDAGSDGSKSSPDRDVVVKQLGETIKHIEERVNSHRSLWLTKNPSLSSVARAVDTITESCSDKDAVQKSTMSRQLDSDEGTNSRDSKPPGPNEGAVQSQRPLTTTRFGSHIVPGPSRPTSTAPSERRFGQWGDLLLLRRLSLDLEPLLQASLDLSPCMVVTLLPVAASPTALIAPMHLSSTLSPMGILKRAPRLPAAMEDIASRASITLLPPRADATSTADSVILFLPGLTTTARLVR